MLSNKDSNLDRQNQNLQCYHYTIRQSLFRILNVSAKIQLFFIRATKNKYFFKRFLYLININKKTDGIVYKTLNTTNTVKKL